MKIPIANIFYLLCYAWQHEKERDLMDVSELDDLELVPDLLGKVLTRGVSRLVRKGLDRGYREIKEDLPGLRGKLAISDMATRALRARGRAACVYEELSHDVIHNRILKSTLGNLLKLDTLHKDVRAEVSAAFRKLEGVSVVRVNRKLFRQLQLDRNRRVYRFLMSICALIHDNLIANEETGTAAFHDFRNEENMWKIFEDFVTEFYDREQTTFRVNARGRRIPWSGAAAGGDNKTKIPIMEADVLLDAPHRRIILDTKFYGHAFGGRGSTEKLHSSNLYQLLTYLRNRENMLPGEAKHDGILLYPVVAKPIHAEVQLEGFRIQARGINLNQPWRNIHNDMLALLD